MGILQAMARVKAPLHESLASPPVNFILVVGEGEPPARMLCPVQSILEAKAGVEMEDTHMIRENTEMLNPEPRTLAVVAVAALDALILLPSHNTALLAALASCASGCTRKRNNKLKGERLCTTL